MPRGLILQLDIVIGSHALRRDPNSGQHTVPEYARAT